MPFLSFWRWVIGITSAPMSPHAEKWQGQLSHSHALNVGSPTYPHCQNQLYSGACARHRAPRAATSEG